MNLDKSAIHFRKNMDAAMKPKIMDLLKIKMCDHHNKYLGLPFCQGPSKRKAFQNVVEKLARKLHGWKLKSLSQAGRGALIKFVAQTISSYAMQTFLLP